MADLPFNSNRTIPDIENIKHSMMFILDKTQRKIGVLANELPKACPYYNDVHTERIQDNLSTLEFEVPANHHPASDILEPEGYIIYTNPANNKQQLFIIKQIEDTHAGIINRKVFCESAYTTDLIANIVRPTVMHSFSLSQALAYVLNGTNYDVGEVEFVGLRDIEIPDYMTSLEALHTIVSEFGELEFEILFDGTKIQKYLVNVVKKRGRDTGKLFEYSKNVTEVKRVSNTNSLVTALIGVGKEFEGKPLTFLNYNAPYDSRFQKYDDYIADMEAFQRFNKDGKHIFGIFNDGEATNAVELYENTKKKLEELSKPQIEYSVGVVTLEALTGLDFYKVNIGDYITVKDFTFNPPLLLNARVMEKKTSLSDPTQSEMTMGDFSLAETNTQQIEIIKRVQQEIKERESEWQEAQSDANEAIEKANQAYQKAEQADIKAGEAKGEASEANQKANEAIGEVAKKLDEEIFTQQRNLLVGELAKKAGVDYVDGLLVDKVNKGDVFTKTEVEEALLGKISKTVYETDQLGIIKRLSDTETWIQQTDEFLLTTATKSDYDALSGTVSELSSTVSQHADLLESTVTKTAFDSLSGTVSSLSSTVSQQANAISQKVSKTDFNGQEIASLINQEADRITIKAEAIDLEGQVTASDLNITTLLEVGNEIQLGGNNSLEDKRIIFTDTATIAGNRAGYSGLPSIYISAYGLKLGANNIYFNDGSSVSTDVHGGEVVWNNINKFRDRTYIKSVYSEYHDGYYLNDHDNGNITLSATGSTLFLGYKATESIRINAPVIFTDGSIRTQAKETGYAGIGGYSWGVSSTACMIGVNFRNRKTAPPSRIEFDKIAGNRNPRYTNITNEGFLLYLEGEGTNGLVYWRGYYTG